ncbi:MAG: MFS transporter [Actinomycetales bacterium]|nr:MFS transporter [Actinomycetales bacterium]
MSSPKRPSNRAWYWAIFISFGIQGIFFATWVSRTPEIQQLLPLNTGQMGLFALAMAIGSLAGLLLGTSAVPLFGARKSIVLCFIVSAVTFPVLGFSAVQHNLLVSIVSAFVFGASMGTGGIASNIEGAMLDSKSHRSILPSLHGSFSFGTLVGAGLGTISIVLGVGVQFQFLAMATISIGAAIVAALFIPRDSGLRQHADMSTTEIRTIPSKKERLAVWREPRTLRVALIGLSFTLAEGTAATWLPISLVDAGLTPAAAAACFTVFVAFMAVGRLGGGVVVDRFGRSRVLLVIALIAASGIAIVMLTNVIHLPYLGAALWGLGCSLGFPLCITSITDDPRLAPPRVSMVFLSGNFGSLAIPPLLGGIGQFIGLFAAFAIPVTVIAAGISVNKATKPVLVLADTDEDELIAR